MDYVKLFDELSQYDTPTICNALQMFGPQFALSGYGKPGMQLKSSKEKIIVGFAITAQIGATTTLTDAEKENRKALYKAAADSQYPSIVCLQDTDSHSIGAFWGEMQASIFKSLGCVGTINDGGVRDVDSADKLDFPFFATKTLVSNANIHVSAVQVPVQICSQKVCPGDIIHADKHGFAVIPTKYAEEVVRVCKELGEAEDLLLVPCQNAIANGVKPAYEDILKWNKACTDAKAAIKARVRASLS